MREGRAKTGSIRSAIAALAFAYLMLLAPSAASAGWNAPTTVSGVGSSTSQTRIAAGTDGDSWVIWKREVGGFDVIQGTRVAAADGSQGPIATLSAPNANATDPVIEARADGSAMVAWLNVSAPDDTVYSRSIAADGTLGPIQIRSAAGPAGRPAKDIALALGADGTAGIAWRKFNGLSWILQAVKVAADGTSGTVQNLSDPASSVTSLDIAAEPAGDPAAVVGYGLVWTGGAGTSGNVFGCQINPDGSFSEPFQALWPYVNPNFPDPGQPDGIGMGGDPHGIQIGYERDGSANIIWLRNRTDWKVNGVPDNLIDNNVSPPVRARLEDDPDDTPFVHKAVERIRLAGGEGVPAVFPGPGVPTTVSPETPVVQGQPYEISSLTVSTPFNGRPVMAWVHNLEGGGSQIQTRQALRGGILQGWAEPAGNSTGIYERPVLVANTNGAAVLSWGVPSAVPGEYNWQWSRFSNSSAATGFTPTDIYSRDVGSVVAESGNTMAAYTGVDPAFVGATKVVTFTSPGIAVTPPSHNFGRVRIGVGATVSIQIRGRGETTSKVTGIALSGSGASDFNLSSANECVKTLNSGENCLFKVTFSPRTTEAETAVVTVNSEVGSFETSLVGRGVNETRNRITAKPRNSAARKGRVVRIRVNAANVGGVASNNTKVCVNLRKRALKLAGNRCRSLGSLAAGASRKLNFRIRVRWRAPRGKKLPVTFRMRSGNAVVRQAVVRIRRKGR